MSRYPADIRCMMRRGSTEAWDAIEALLSSARSGGCALRVGNTEAMLMCTTGHAPQATPNALCCRRQHVSTYSSSGIPIPSLSLCASTAERGLAACPWPPTAGEYCGNARSWGLRVCHSCCRTVLACASTRTPPPSLTPLTLTRYMRTRTCGLGSPPESYRPGCHAEARAARGSGVASALLASIAAAWSYLRIIRSLFASAPTSRRENKANDSSCRGLSHHRRPCRRELAPRPHTRNVTARHSRAQPASGQ
jgi:hypothetical protein